MKASAPVRRSDTGTAVGPELGKWLQQRGHVVDLVDVPQAVASPQREVDVLVGSTAQHGVQLAVYLLVVDRAAPVSGRITRLPHQLTPIGGAHDQPVGELRRKPLSEAGA